MIDKQLINDWNPDAKVKPMYVDIMPDSETILEDIASMKKIAKGIDEERRIEALSQLHKVGHRCEWIIGEILLIQERDIVANYERWKAKKLFGKVPVGEYEGFKSIRSWIEAHKNELGFGPRTGDRYIEYRRSTDEESRNKISPTKVEECNRAPKEHRESIMEKAQEYNWSIPKIREEVKRAKEKTSELKKIEETPRPKASITREKGLIVIDVSPKYQDKLLNYLTDHIDDIMKKILL